MYYFAYPINPRKPLDPNDPAPECWKDVDTSDYAKARHLSRPPEIFEKCMQWEEREKKRLEGWYKTHLSMDERLVVRSNWNDKLVVAMTVLTITSKKSGKINFGNLPQYATEITSLIKSFEEGSAEPFIDAFENQFLLFHI